MNIKSLPDGENIYDTQCPILYAMELIGQKWKLPILWYIADSENQTLRYKALERKVVGITPTMLTKCLRELEHDQHQYIEPRTDLLGYPFTIHRHRERPYGYWTCHIELKIEG